MRHRLYPHFILVMAVFGCAELSAAKTPGVTELNAMSGRFALAEIRVDVSKLPANERRALVKLVEAAQIVDTLYLRQASARNETRLRELLADRTPLGVARLDYFLLNKGPWSELDEDRPFLAGIETRPEQSNFYPSDVTRTEVDAWLKLLAQNQHEAAAGFFTTIRRAPDGKLLAVPYSLEYQPELMDMARLLRDAAALTEQLSLRAFLEKRAAAFLNNDYYDSDIAWMELDASIEPTIGPYEVYQDKWFNFKAAFEAIIAVKDPVETQKLERFSHELQELEDHLPIDPQFRRVKLGGFSPISVVNVVCNAGDANHGVQLAAFNLPNDERVVAAKGSKRVMLRNFQQAKFDKVLVPISKIALATRDQPWIAFESFFTHQLMHELMHGLGPQTITVDGRETSVRRELKELNGPLEEAKADISGLWALQYLMNKGVIDPKQERSVYATFLASMFRTLRFGLSESHAKGMALQMNYFLDHGAIHVAADGTFALDLGKTKAAVTGLTHDIMTLQAHGDYAGTHALLDRMIKIRPEVQHVIDRLNQVPVDIAPKLLTAQELLRQQGP